MRWPEGREVERKSDMGPNRLRIVLDADNDVCVAVWHAEGCADVEFCSAGNGGGKSPRTREALIALMVAMEDDAKEKR